MRRSTKPCETLLRTSQSEFPVIDDEGKPVGLLGRADMIRALKQLGPDARVAEAMSTHVPTISHRACLDDAFRILQENPRPRRRRGRCGRQAGGLVTSETIGEMLMLHEAPAEGARFGPWGPWNKPAT